jgi:hypothetical protein
MEQELASVMKAMKEIHLMRAEDVDENVKQTMNVPRNSLASEINALTPAWEHVVLMQSVKFKDMFHNARVQLDTLAILSSNVEKNLELHRREQILVFHLHAVQTLNADKSITKQFVHVCQATLEVHLAVDLSALSTLSAPRKWHVLTRNVKILVQTLAELRQIAKPSTTIQSVLVLMDTPEIPSLDALEPVRIFNSL